MSKSHVTGWASDAPTPAQLKELFAQIESGRITKERIQTFLGPEVSVFGHTVKLNHDLSLAAMIVAGRYDLCHRKITEEHFPRGTIRGTVDADIILVHYDRCMSTYEVLSDFIRRGYRAATIYELLALGADQTTRDLQRHFPIVALGSPWQDPENDVSVVACLSRDASRRELGIRWIEYGWDSTCRFAALRTTA